MKLVSKMILLLSLFLMAVIVTPVFVGAESDTLSTFLLYTDYSSEYTQTIYEGESISLSTVAISHSGTFDYQKLEIVGGITLFKEYSVGDYMSPGRYRYDRNFELRSDVLKLNPGTYTIRFTAKTNSGEEQSRDLTLNILEYEDETSPVVSIRYPNDGQTYADYINNFEFKATDDNLKSCSYSLNDEGNVSTLCQDDIWKRISIQSKNGLNELTVYAEDESGNIGSKTITFRVEIEEEDSEAPIISIRYPNDGQTYTDYVNDFEFKAADDNLYVCSYSLNGGSQEAVSCENDVWESVDINSLRGENTLTVYAKDLSDNVASKTISFTVSIDDQAPIVEILSPEDNSQYDTRVEEFSFVVEDDNLQLCWYKLNDDPTEIIDCEDNVLKTVDGLFSLEGWNTLTVYARDESQNVGSDTVSFNIDFGYHDDEGPEITVITPTYNGEYEESIRFDLRVSETADVVYSLDGEDNVTMDEVLDLRFNSNRLDLEDGEYEVTFYATDLEQNTASVTVPFSIFSDEDDDNDDDSEEDCCDTINLNDFPEVEKELDDFYKNREEEKKNRRLNSIRLGYDDEGKLVVKVTLGEKIYYGIVGYIVLMIALVLILFYVVEKRKRRF